MARKRATLTKVVRDAKTGKFIPVKAAQRGKSTVIVETTKRKWTKPSQTFAKQ